MNYTKKLDCTAGKTESRNFVKTKCLELIWKHAAYKVLEINYFSH
jgi:hypothetical protein